MSHFSIKLIFIILVLSKSTSLCSQIPKPDFEVHTTVEFENKKKELFERILFSDEEGHYALFNSGKNGNGKKSIRKLSNDLQPLDYRFTLTHNKKVKSAKSIEIIVANDNIFHIWTARTREGIDYYVQELDLKSRSLKSEKRIARVGYDDSFFEYTKASIEVDEQFNKIYLYVQLMENSKEKKKIRLFRYDLNFKLLQTENYQLPYTFEKFVTSYIKPFGTERTILIGKNHHHVQFGKSVRNKEYEYGILNLEKNQVKLLKEIHPDSQHLKNILANIKGEKLLVTGLLANQNISKPSSIYFLSYNLQASQIENEKISVLPNSFYRQPEEREEKIGAIQLGIGYKKRNIDNHYSLKNLFTTSTDEILLIAEQSYAMQHSYSSMAGSNFMATGTSGATHYANDIAVFKLNLSGDLVWTSNIIKRQEWGGSDMYLSFYPVYDNNKLFLVYNGNYLNIEGSGNFLRGRDAALLCAVVEHDGSFQRKIVSHYTEEYPIIGIPILSSYTKQFGIFIYSRGLGNSKRQKFTRVSLN